MSPITLNSAPPPTRVRDVTDATFMQDVIETSQKTPVIVDFWAPWCGPCKTLTPNLEKAVNTAKSNVILAKINIDQNQQIAGSLRIQSVPTVFAFWQGQPVDGFQGAQPLPALTAFVDKLLHLAGQTAAHDPLVDQQKQGEDMLAQGAAAQAAQTFAAILANRPDDANAFSGLIRAYLSAGQIDNAQNMLQSASADMLATPPMKIAAAGLALATEAQNLPPLETLQNQAANNPNDHQTQFDLAMALYGRGQIKSALDTLLVLLKQAPDWQEGAAKKQILKIIETLPTNDKMGMQVRRRMSSILFA